MPIPTLTLACFALPQFSAVFEVAVSSCHLHRTAVELARALKSKIWHSESISIPVECMHTAALGHYLLQLTAVYSELMSVACYLTAL